MSRLVDSFKSYGFARVPVPKPVWKQFEEAVRHFRQNIQRVQSERRSESDLPVELFLQGDRPDDRSRLTWTSKDTWDKSGSLRRYATIRDWPASMCDELPTRMLPGPNYLRQLHESVREVAFANLAKALDGMTDSSLDSRSAPKQWQLPWLATDADDLHSVLELKAYLTQPDDGTTEILAVSPSLDHPPVQRFIPHADLSLVTVLLQHEPPASGAVEHHAQTDKDCQPSGVSTRLEVLRPPTLPVCASQCSDTWRTPTPTPTCPAMELKLSTSALGSGRHSTSRAELAVSSSSSSSPSSRPQSYHDRAHDPDLGGSGGQEWDTMEPERGEGLINVGEFGRIASRGEWRNAVHRVVEVHRAVSGANNGDSRLGAQNYRCNASESASCWPQARVSAALFLQPPWDLPLRRLFARQSGRGASILATGSDRDSKSAALTATEEEQLKRVLEGSAQDMEIDDYVGDWQPF